eukprot:3211914-Rhodomonas_salina.1
MVEQSSLFEIAERFRSRDQLAELFGSYDRFELTQVRPRNQSKSGAFALHIVPEMSLIDPRVWELRLLRFGRVRAPQLMSKFLDQHSVQIGRCFLRLILSGQNASPAEASGSVSGSNAASCQNRRGDSELELTEANVWYKCGLTDANGALLAQSWYKHEV